MRAFDHAPTEPRRVLILGGGFACLTDGQAARRPAAVPMALRGAGLAS